MFRCIQRMVHRSGERGAERPSLSLVDGRYVRGIDRVCAAGSRSVPDQIRLGLTVCTCTPGRASLCSAEERWISPNRCPLFGADSFSHCGAGWAVTSLSTNLSSAMCGTTRAEISAGASPAARRGSLCRLKLACCARKARSLFIIWVVHAGRAEDTRRRCLLILVLPAGAIAA